MSAETRAEPEKLPKPLQKLNADLYAAIAAIDRHREELARLKREVASLTRKPVSTD